MDNKQPKEENTKNRYWTYLLLFAILLFFATFGITYSIKHEENPDDNIISTGKILFSYSDVSSAGNGIKLLNATPISDNLGKAMVGEGNYFDFSITATTTNSKLKYKVLVNKDSNSTLKDEDIKLYLTNKSGNLEQELVLKKVSDLKQEKINNKQYYVLYENEILKELKNFSRGFRLRMWIDNDTTDYFDKNYSLKIDVVAVQTEE